MFCVGHFNITVTKIPKRNSSREEKMILAYGFREPQSTVAGKAWQNVSVMAAIACGRSCSHYSSLRIRDEARIEGVLSYNLQRTTANELIYQLCFNFQRFQSLLKYCCPLWIKCPPHEFEGDVLYSNHSKENSFCGLHLYSFSVIVWKTACH